MIAAINNFHRILAGSDTTAGSTSSATSASSSTGFGNELDSQLALPNILSVFEGTAAYSGSSSPASTTPAAPLAPATQAATAQASVSQDPTAQPLSDSQAPTAQSVFGDQPWMQNPQGNAADGTTWNYNPIYFASQATAEQVASMVGGTVFQENAITSAPGTPLQQTTPNEMVQLPNGTVLNPGLIADFYDHGYSQSMVDQMIQNEIKGV